MNNPWIILLKINNFLESILSGWGPRSGLDQQDDNKSLLVLLCLNFHISVIRNQHCAVFKIGVQTELGELCGKSKCIQLCYNELLIYYHWEKQRGRELCHQSRSQTETVRVWPETKIQIKLSFSSKSRLCCMVFTKDSKSEKEKHLDCKTSF